MELSIKINLDNDAYQGDYERGIELANNLHSISENILRGNVSGIVRDSNGNKTGIFEINATADDLKKPSAISPEMIGTVYFTYFDKTLNCRREAQEPISANQTPETAAREYLRRNANLFGLKAEFFKIDFLGGI
jgi:hypothetical protein